MQSLFRGGNNKKLADFLVRDFSQAKHRDAACKNAFVLLGQHRHELAAAFFVLGELPGFPQMIITITIAIMDNTLNEECQQ